MPIVAAPKALLSRGRSDDAITLRAAVDVDLVRVLGQNPNGGAASKSVEAEFQITTHVGLASACSLEDLARQYR